MHSNDVLKSPGANFKTKIRSSARSSRLSLAASCAFHANTTPSAYNFKSQFSPHFAPACTDLFHYLARIVFLAVTSIMIGRTIHSGSLSMAAFDDVVIISGCRTPVGKFQGSLADFTRAATWRLAVREAVKRAGIEPRQVDECIMGNVVAAGLGQNPARQAAIFGGLPPEVGAMTINKVCGSGLKAVALAAQAIQTGNSSIVVAGGMESMTNAPYLLPQARKGYRLGNGQVIDSMVHDGLWDIYNDYHMGITGENVAEKYGITREEQDEFAVNSHRKAISAIKECRFKSQIVPVEIPAKKKGQPAVIFDKDESPREDTTIETLRASEARIQERRHRHRRQRPRSQRWRCCPGRHQRDARERVGC